MTSQPQSQAFANSGPARVVEGTLRLQIREDGQWLTINTATGPLSAVPKLRKTLEALQHGWERSGFLGEATYRITDWFPNPPLDLSAYGICVVTGASSHEGA